MKGRTGVRAALAAIVLVVAIGVLEAKALAAPAPIAQVPAGTPLSGGDGWLVWSAPVPAGYALMGYHEGTVRELPAAARPQPFDASVGTDSSGAPVVVFSRCASTPAMIGTGGQTPGGELVEALGGVGCRIHLLPLGGGGERALPIPTGRGVSDTTPSIWKGVVTFGESAPAHGEVMQVIAWSPRTPRKLTTLRHGVVPECPRSRAMCRELPTQAEISALASDGSAIAFLWRGKGGAVGLDGDSELRIDRPDGRGATTAGATTGQEACMGAAAGEHTLERVAFSAPFLAGRTISFGQLDTFGCFTGFAGLLVTHGVGPGYSSAGKLAGVVPLALATDEGRLYGLLAPLSEGSSVTQSWTFSDGPYCSSDFPCAIEQVATPALKRERNLPFDPRTFYG
jgi:hypothetical protein